jgi:CRISPR/Cas system CSM-associated protein Csm3 (group 7 of RAMP superfamily)
MIRKAYTLKLVLKSPFMFEGVVNNRVGVDSAYVRGESGEPVIPASQVKGVLRDALEVLIGKLLSAEDVALLFGSASANSGAGEQDRPDRGLALFQDLSAVGPLSTSETVRIEIDDETGTVKKGHLQIVELAAPFGQPVAFEGKLVIRYARGLDAARIEKAVRAALKLIPAIGAYKSAGFGEVVNEECSLTETTTAAGAAIDPAQAVRTAYHVTFDCPILVDTTRVADNHFKGAAIVPGSAIKGALAEQLALAGENPEDEGSKLGEAISTLTVSHAFPIDAQGRELDLPIPDSVFTCERASKDYKGEKEHLFVDGILAPQPGMGLIISGAVVAPDNVATGKDKDKQLFRAQFDRPSYEPDWLVRTHIGMNEDRVGERIAREKRTFTAADEKLYSSQMVGTRNKTWRIVVDPSRIEDKSLAAKLMSMLEAGLDGIGRTAASATFKRSALSDQTMPEANVVDILLLTPAVLFDPAEAGGQFAKARYKAYFQSQLDVELVNFFARQSLAGQYPAMRRRPYGRNVYYPFVQTRPGAVFRLKVSGAEGRRKLGDALKFGLPVPPLGGKPASWRTCPFVPENGFGRIALHRICQSEGVAVDYVGEA